MDFRFMTTLIFLSLLRFDGFVVEIFSVISFSLSLMTQTDDMMIRCTQLARQGIQSKVQAEPSSGLSWAATIATNEEKDLYRIIINRIIIFF